MKLWNELLTRLLDEATDGADGATDGAASETNTDVDDAAADSAGSESDTDGDAANADPDDKGDADDGSDTDGAPENYADFELIDGQEMDTAMLEAFSPEFKKLGLTQEQAQGLVTIQAGMVQAGQQAQIDAFSQQNEEWATAAKTDKEYGGDKFDESVSFAQKAVETFGTPELKEALDSTGLGNHPELIRLMNRVGRALGEDVPGGGSNLTSEKDQASLMYPTT